MECDQLLMTPSKDSIGSSIIQSSDQEKDSLPADLIIWQVEAFTKALFFLLR